MNRQYSSNCDERSVPSAAVQCGCHEPQRSLQLPTINDLSHDPSGIGIEQDIDLGHLGLAGDLALAARQCCRELVLPVQFLAGEGCRDVDILRTPNCRGPMPDPVASVRSAHIAAGPKLSCIG